MHSLYGGDVYLQAVEKPFVEPSPMQVIRLRNRLINMGGGNYVSEIPLPRDVAVLHISHTGQTAPISVSRPLLDVKQSDPVFEGTLVPTSADSNPRVFVKQEGLSGDVSAKQLAANEDLMASMHAAMWALLGKSLKGTHDSKNDK